MATYTVSNFPRIEGSQLGQGTTTEYRTERGETLAYVDYNEAGTEASVTVFNPYKGGERRYANRPAKAAEEIAVKHCRKY